MTDSLTAKQRSYCMSRVKGKDTGIERLVRSILYKRGYRFRKHDSTLPGKPDIIFPKNKVAVFLDGDFWHGYRFAAWQMKIPPFWQRKIAETRRRDKRNFLKLRRYGWKVLRLWQHQIERDIDKTVETVISLL